MYLLELRLLSVYLRFKLFSIFHVTYVLQIYIIILKEENFQVLLYLSNSSCVVEGRKLLRNLSYFRPSPHKGGFCLIPQKGGFLR